MFSKSNTYVVTEELLEEIKTGNCSFREFFRIYSLSVVLCAQDNIILGDKVNSSISKLIRFKILLIRYLRRIQSRVFIKRLRRGSRKILRKLVFIRLLLDRRMKREILDLLAPGRSRRKRIRRSRRSRYYFVHNKVRRVVCTGINTFRITNIILYKKKRRMLRRSTIRARIIRKRYYKRIRYLPNQFLAEYCDDVTLFNGKFWYLGLYHIRYVMRMRKYFRRFYLKLFKKIYQRRKRKVRVRGLKKFKRFFKKLNLPKIRFVRSVARLHENILYNLQTNRQLFVDFNKTKFFNINFRQSLAMVVRRLYTRKKNRLRKYLNSFHLESRRYVSFRLKNRNYLYLKSFSFKKLLHCFRPSLYESATKKIIITARKRNFFFTVADEKGDTRFMLWLGRADIIGKFEKRRRFFDIVLVRMLHNFLFNGFFLRPKNCGIYTIVLKMKLRRRRLRLMYYQILRSFLSRVYRFRYANTRRYRKFFRRFKRLRRLLLLVRKRLFLLKSLKQLLVRLRKIVCFYAKKKQKLQFLIFRKKFLLYFLTYSSFFFSIKRRFYKRRKYLQTRRGYFEGYLKGILRRYKRRLKAYRPKYAVNLPGSGLRFTRWIYSMPVRHGNGVRAKKKKRL